MKGKIKVRLEGGSHSAGRGVGFYRNHLATSLTETGEVELVEKGEELIHYPFFDLFYPTLPTTFSLPTVVTIHDVTPLVLADYYPMGLRARFALSHQKTALKKVRAVLTDSLSSKKDIVQLLNLPEDKVTVTPLAANPIYKSPPNSDVLKVVKEKYSLPDKFALYVGGVNPNKNLLRLARVCLRLNLPLVLVGSEFTKVPVQTFSVKKLFGLQSTHPELQEFEKLRLLISENPNLITPGFVSDEDLNAIYRLAALYCQPSLYEGFGLPLLEALTAGCLVVSSNTGSPPEIYPEDTISFNPENELEMENAVAKAISLSPKEKKEKVKAGQKKAAEFSWEKTAALTLEIYRSVLQ